MERRPETFGEEGSEYSVESLVYPPNLGWMTENQNYVVFYINVPAESTIKLEDGNSLGELDPIVGSVGTQDGWIRVKPYKRLKSAIALPIIERPTAKYGADWDMTSLGPVVGWALTQTADPSKTIVESFKSGDYSQGAAKAWGGIKDMGSVGADALKAIGLSALNVGAGIIGLGGEASTTDLFSVISRTAMNEHRTQLFKSMRFRSFAFDYRFHPRNAEEADTIKNIIQTFKYHMHPERGTKNLFLTYPSEFDIVFYWKGNENSGKEVSKQNLFKISTCALTDFEVDYGGEQFYTFSDGMPSEIGLRLGFMELEVLTADRVKEGF
jgi:hypothetical protein